MDRFDKILIGLFVLLILVSVFWFNSFIVPVSRSTTLIVSNPTGMAANQSAIAALGASNEGAAQEVVAAEVEVKEQGILNTAKDKLSESLAAAKKAAKEATYAGAYKAGLSQFSRQLARDTAIWVASGGEGQQPLFVTEGWEAYLKDIGDAALGEAIDEFVTGNWGEGVFKDLCEPNFNIKLGIILGIQQDDIHEPRCKFSEIVDNWESAIDNVDFSLEYRVAIQRENDIYLYLRTQSELLSAVEEKVSLAESKLNASEGWLGQEGLAGAILTPGSMVRKSFEDSHSGEIPNWKDSTPTGTILDFIETFLNTLASQLLKRLQTGLFSNTSSRSGYNYLSSLYGYSSSPYRSGVSGAETGFDNFIESKQRVGSIYNILSKLMLCTDEKVSNPGPTDCVIDEILSSAISNKMLINDLPQSVKNRPFAPKVNQVINPQTAFTLRNVTILRKYRIVPVGWEVAARYISEQSDRAYTLGDLIDLYKQGCDSDSTTGDEFLCDLIDPYWVLKAPELFCRREGYGPDLSLAGDDDIDRTSYCADEQQCLKEDENGNCLNFGYCTEEKRIWDLGVKNCEPKFNTCQTVQLLDGGQESFLTNTLDFANCGFENAGCRWYSNNQRYGAEFTNVWGWTNTDNNKIYFDRDVEACDSSNDGCSQFIRTKGGLGTNLLINGSFEIDSSHDQADLGWDDLGSLVVSSESYDGSSSYFIDQSDYQQDGSQYFTMRAGSRYALSALVYIDTIPTIGSFDLKLGSNNIDINNDIEIISSGDVSVEGDGWQRIFKVFTSNVNQVDAVNVQLITSGGFDGSYYVDAVQFEEITRGGNYVSDYTPHDPSQMLQSQLVYLNKAPDYYECYLTGDDEWPDTLTELNTVLDEETRNGECNSYAGVCMASEVGCQLYSPINGDPAVPATITTNDICPSECVGYQVYKQEKTNFIGTKYTQFIADNTPQYCSANYSGCDEFTNIDTVDSGGEGLEYYVDLRECQKPGEGEEGSFVTWRGDDTKGYALKDYKLRKSNEFDFDAPSTNMRYNDSGSPISVDSQISVVNNPSILINGKMYLDLLNDAVENAISASGVDDVNGYLDHLNKNNNITDSDILNADILDSLHGVGICVPQEIRGYSYYDNKNTPETDDDDYIYVPINPDCTEFYSSSGDVSYRLLSRVIYVSDVCKPYRRTQTQANLVDAREDCIDSSGHWNGDDECIYRAIPNQGVTCPAQSRGCREYIGNQGGNVRNVSFDTFESGINDWEGVGVALTQEAASAGGVSVKASELKKDFLLSNNKAYILSFWAKGEGSGNINFSSISFFNGDVGDAGEIKYFADSSNETDAPQISVGELWQRYELGPVFVDWDLAMVELKFSVENQGTSVYFDNILLKEVKDSVYLTENSWWTPFSCDNKLNDPDGARAVSEASCSSTGAQTRCNVGEMLSCSSYEDSDSEKFNLRSFESLCRLDAVGCEELIDTKNNDQYYSQTYNTENDISPGNDDDNVVVPADSLVYLVSSADHSCDSDNKGCTAYGLPTIEITPTGLDTETEEIVGYDTVYYKNTPDEYADILCARESLWCDEYSSDNGLLWFKDPRDKICEYQVSDDGSYGWYKGEEKRACVITEMMTIGFGTAENKIQPMGQRDFMTGDDQSTSYNGWVGVCPAAQSGCSEYVDPSVNNYANLVLNGNLEQDVDGLNGADHWIASSPYTNSTFYDEDDGRLYGGYQSVNVDSDTLYTVSAVIKKGDIGDAELNFGCERSVDIISPDDSMTIVIAGATNEWKKAVVTISNETENRFSGRFYIKGDSGSRCWVGALINSTTPDLTGYIDDVTLVKSGVYYVRGELDKTTCNGIVDTDIGCVLLNDNKLMNEKGTTLSDINDHLIYNASLTGKGPGSPHISNVKNDSNIIAKVYPNRECYSWLHCITYEKDDLSASYTTFGDSDRCLNIGLCKSLGSNGQCNNLVSSFEDNLTPQLYDETAVNKTGYSYYGKNNLVNDVVVSGYAPYYKMKQIGEVAEVSNGNFESTFKNTDEPVGWLAYNKISTGGRMPVDTGLYIISDISEAREGANYLQLNTSYEADSETIDVYSSTKYIISGWINSLDLYPYSSSTRSGILIQEMNHNGVVTRDTNFNCGEHADCDPWAYDVRNWQAWDNLITYSGRPWGHFYQEIITGPNTGRIKIKLANWSEIGPDSPGISCDTTSQTELGGEVMCDVGGRSYFDQISIKPFLQVSDDPAFAERRCRLYPQYNSPSCEYVNDSTVYHGWSGYCLVKDPENSKICLQWWPIDRIKGDNIDESVGYAGKIPLYYTVEFDYFGVTDPLDIQRDLKEFATNYKKEVVDNFELKAVCEGNPAKRWSKMSNTKYATNPAGVFTVSGLENYYSFHKDWIDSITLDAECVKGGYSCDLILTADSKQLSKDSKAAFPDPDVDVSEVWTAYKPDPGDHYGPFYAFAYFDADGYFSGVEFHQWDKSSGQDCGDSKANINGIDFKFKKIGASKIAQVVTPFGKSKYWSSRVQPASDFVLPCNRNFVSIINECGYYADGEPFGSVIPPSGGYGIVANPMKWSGSSDSREPLYYIDDSVLEARKSESTYDGSNIARMGQYHSQDWIKKIFAQSYNIYRWTDALGSYCDFADGSCSSDTSVSCNSSSGCNVDLGNCNKYCNLGFNHGNRCSELANCEVSNACSGWVGGTSTTSGEPGVCVSGSDNAGGSCNGANQGAANLQCLPQTSNARCILDNTTKVRECNSGVNSGRDCEDDSDCTSLSGTCSVGFRAIKNGPLDYSLKTCGPNGPYCTTQDDCSVSFGVCVGVCNDASGVAQVNSTCSRLGECLNQDEPAYMLSAEPGWGVPNILCRYDQDATSLNSAGVSQRRPGNENGLDNCGVAPVVFEIEVEDKDGVVDIHGGGKVVKLDFNAYVNENQLPLASYRVDWGDGTAISVSGVNLRARPNKENSFTLYHYYDYWQLRARGCINDEFCRVIPRVHVRDNWGWCNSSGEEESDIYRLNKGGYYSGNNSYIYPESGYDDIEQWANFASGSGAVGVLNQYNVGWWSTPNGGYAWCKPDRNEDGKIILSFPNAVSPGKLDIYFAGPGKGWTIPSLGVGENYGISKLEISPSSSGSWSEVGGLADAPNLLQTLIVKNDYNYSVDLTDVSVNVKRVRITVPGANPAGNDNGVWGCVDAVKLTERTAAGDPFDCDVGENVNSDAWATYGGEVRVYKN
jgi:hypothetical protein